MSISSRITEMEQHIGNAYDKIEDLGVDLTNVDKNINNISSMLEEVWNEYPKVTATDVEEATLNGTKKGRMEIDLKGNTEQDGEPTPETTIAIKNVTGNSNVKIQNKNLFNGTFEIGGYYIENGNKDQSTNRIRTIDYLELKAGTYTLSFKNQGSVYVLKYDKNKTYLGYSQVIYRTTEGSFTLENNVEYITFYYIPYNHELTIDEICQLEQGTTATSYVPHQEQNYPFTFASGQFLADDEELQDNGMYKEWGKIVLNGTQDIQTVNWRASETSVGWIYPYNLTNNKNDYTNTELPDILCNKLIRKTYSELYNKVDEGIGLVPSTGGTAGIIVRIKNPDLTTREAINSYLAQNPLTVIYKKAQPYIIPYNSTQQAQYNAIKQARSYDDQTNISSTSDELGFKMDVEILSNGVSSSNTRTLALGSLDKGSLNKGSVNNINEVDTEDTEVAQDAENETSVESEE